MNPESVQNRHITRLLVPRLSRPVTMPLPHFSNVCRIAALLPLPVLVAAAAVTPPKPITTVAPKHPPELYEQAVDGSATVRFKVNTDGTVSDAVVMEASDPAFGEAAVEAVLQWKLEPAVQDGKSVAIKVSQQFSFNVPVHKKLEKVAGRPVFVDPPDKIVPMAEIRPRPRPVVPPRPIYPDKLKGSGKEGVVHIEFIINKAGLPVNPRITGTEGDDFKMWAVLSLIKARWEPIEHEGEIVAVSVRFPMRFSETAQQGRRRGGGG